MSDIHVQKFIQDGEVLRLKQQIAALTAERDALRVRNEQLTADNKRMADRLCIDPGGGDAIDEAEMALEFVKHDRNTLTAERDALQAELDTARGLLGKLIINPRRSVHRYDDGQAMICPHCKASWWVDGDEHHKEDCPAVQARDYLDGKPVTDWRKLAGELIEQIKLGKLTDEIGHIFTNNKAYIEVCEALGVEP